MVVAFFYCIFLFVIVYVRLDFSISRDEAAEAKLKVASYVESAQSVLDRRSALYQAYDDAVNKYKVSCKVMRLHNGYCLVICERILFVTCKSIMNCFPAGVF